MCFRADQIVTFRTAGGGLSKARLHAWVGPQNGVYRLYAREVVPGPSAGRLVTLRVTDPTRTAVEAVLP